MNNFNSFRIENLPKTRNITRPMILNRVMSRESLELLERYRNGEQNDYNLYYCQNRIYTEYKNIGKMED